LRELLKMHSPDILIARLPPVPTLVDKKGKKRTGNLAMLVRQQLALGKHVIVLDAPLSQTWNTTDIEILSDEPRLSTLFVRWCGFGIQDDQTKLRLHRVTKVLTSLNFSVDLNACCGETSHIHMKASNFILQIWYDKFVDQVLKALMSPSNSSVAQPGNTRPEFKTTSNLSVETSAEEAFGPKKLESVAQTAATLLSSTSISVQGTVGLDSTCTTTGSTAKSLAPGYNFPLQNEKLTFGVATRPFWPSFTQQQLQCNINQPQLHSTSQHR